MQVRGTVKVAVLKGDPGCASLIAATVYDTKPVHFLSMSAESIQWVENERHVYNVEKQQMEWIKFLRLNVNDDYNNGMGDVDASDQLRNYYRFDHWLRKTKWWWSFLFWAKGVMLVNAYVLYVRHNTMMGKTKKGLLSQYEFRKQIALAWIAPDKYDPRFVDKDKREAKRKRKSPSPSHSIASNSSQSRCAKLPPRMSPRMNAADDVRATPAPRFTDSSLAIGGSLSMRLRTDLKHRPAPERKPKSKCQLHRWASGFEYRAGTLWCQDCQVHLCVGCFSTFHDVEDLIKNKVGLESLFQEQNTTKQTKRKVRELGNSATQVPGV